MAARFEAVATVFFFYDRRRAGTITGTNERSGFRPKKSPKKDLSRFLWPLFISSGSLKCFSSAFFGAFFRFLFFLVRVPDFCARTAGAYCAASGGRRQKRKQAGGKKGEERKELPQGKSFERRPDATNTFFFF